MTIIYDLEASVVYSVFSTCMSFLRYLRLFLLSENNISAAYVFDLHEGRFVRAVAPWYDCAVLF